MRGYLPANGAVSRFRPPDAGRGCEPQQRPTGPERAVPSQKIYNNDRNHEHTDHTEGASTGAAGLSARPLLGLPWPLQGPAPGIGCSALCTQPDGIAGHTTRYIFTDSWPKM